MRHPLNPPKPQTKVERLKSEVNDMLRADNWQPATPDHVMILHCICHERVYGVSTPEESGKDFTIARVQAKRILREEFAEDMSKFIVFIRWFWSREKSREKYRRDTGSPSTFRADWRSVFSRRAVTDYKLSIAREAEKL